MESIIAEAIGLGTHPVALIWADDAPQGAIRFKAGVWGCVMSAFATVVARGRSAAFDRATFGCWGGGVGLGFGNRYEDFPGGVDGFCAFLSNGNEPSAQGCAAAEGMKAAGWQRMADDFLHGERYLKDPETVRTFMDALPMCDIQARFVVMKPLEQAVPEKENVKSVTFFVDPDRLSALVILANYAHGDGESVIILCVAAARGEAGDGERTREGEPTWRCCTRVRGPA